MQDMEHTSEGILSAEDLDFLETLTRDVADASRVAPGQRIGGFGPNTTGGTIVKPGGGDCYPAFWVRDFVMSLEAGISPIAEQEHALALIARTQQETDWNTPSGSLVPRGAIVDHISLDGKPIFFPGTVDDYENQGGIWGDLPSLDDHFFFIHLAWHLAFREGKAECLQRPVAGTYIAGTSDTGTSVAGTSLIDRLELAYAVPPYSKESLLVRSDEHTRGVSFGFVDSVEHTGDLLFCSLLKYRAAGELAELFGHLGDSRRQTAYAEQARILRESIDKTFPCRSGLPAASTRSSAQADVWGAAFGVCIGAFAPGQAREIGAALRDAYREGSLSYRGNIRHLRTWDDFDENTAWEKTIGGQGAQPKNRYQNGAYWGTPVGWVCGAIAGIDRKCASDLAKEYIQELREGDYRKGPGFGSPWECLHPTEDYRQNAVYLTSVACPLAAFKKSTEEDFPH